MSNPYTQHARRLATRLKEVANVNLKHAHCLEAIAAIHGYPNWDTFVAVGMDRTVSGPEPMITSNLRGECFFEGGGQRDDRDYEVRISADEIVISYAEDGEIPVWRGKNPGTGHYKLALVKPKSSQTDWMTLHYSNGNERMLEGSFVEGDDEGMIRIYLDT